MRAASTQFRRFVASLMLLAMASFGLHNGALGGFHRHGPAQIECGAGHRHAHASEEGAHAADMHKAAHHDHHHRHGAPVELPEEPAEPASAGFDGSCCTGGCSVAVTAPVPQAVPAPLTALLRLLPEAQSGIPTTLDGLKRPPRSIRIA